MTDLHQDDSYPWSGKNLSPSHSLLLLVYKGQPWPCPPGLLLFWAYHCEIITVPPLYGWCENLMSTHKAQEQCYHYGVIVIVFICWCIMRSLTVSGQGPCLLVQCVCGCYLQMAHRRYLYIVSRLMALSYFQTHCHLRERSPETKGSTQMLPYNVTLAVSGGNGRVHTTLFISRELPSHDTPSSETFHLC